MYYVYTTIAWLLMQFICTGGLAQNGEPFRPGFHFSPKATWTNDPNGLFYFLSTIGCT